MKNKIKSKTKFNNYYQHAMCKNTDYLTDRRAHDRHARMDLPDQDRVRWSFMESL